LDFNQTYSLSLISPPYVNIGVVSSQCDDYFDIVTEEAEGGELHDRLAELTSRLDEDTVRVIAFNLLDAIAFLQHRNIAHRDVKPENILLRKPKVTRHHACQFKL
jgi:serine/threonine protein kinase